MNLTILIDSREKLPFLFPNQKTRKTKLDCGDYSLHGFKKALAVERKGYQEYLGCISTNLQLFNSQLSRLSKLRYSIVVVSGDLSMSELGNYHAQYLSKKDVIYRTTRLMIKHGVPIIFLKNKKTAQEFTENYLEAAYDKHSRN